MTNKKTKRAIPETLTDSPKVIKSMKAIQRAGWCAVFTGLLSIVLGVPLIIWLGVNGHVDSDIIIGAVAITIITNVWLIYSGLRLEKLKDSSAVTKLLLWLNIIIPCTVVYLNQQTNQSESSSSSRVGALTAITIIMTIIALVKIRPYRQWRQTSKSKVQTSDAETIKDPETYAAILLDVSTRAANELKKKHNLLEKQGDKLVTQVVGFGIICLMRAFRDATIPPHKSREFISEAIQIIAKMTNPEHKQDTYTELNQALGKLSREYGGLPLSNAGSDKLGGTLLWEYGKLVSKTIDPSFDNDLITLMDNISVITSVNSSVKIDGLVDSLK